VKASASELQTELERWRVRQVEADWDDVVARIDVAHQGVSRRSRRRLARRFTLVLALAAALAGALLAIPGVGGAIESLLPGHGDSRFGVRATVTDARGIAIAEVELRAHSRLLVVERRDGKHIRVWTPGRRPIGLASWRWDVRFGSKPRSERVALRIGRPPEVTITLCSSCRQHASGLIFGGAITRSLMRGETTVVITGARSGVKVLPRPATKVAVKP
jgi:hypothetical protein